MPTTTTALSFSLSPSELLVMQTQHSCGMQATNLTAAPSAAPMPACLDFNVTQPAPVADAQTFYSLTIQLEDCFLGQACTCFVLLQAMQAGGG